MNKRLEQQMIREGDLLISIDVELMFDDHPWAPFISPSDADRLVLARRALKKGDLPQAQQYGRVFRLTPVQSAAS